MNLPDYSVFDELQDGVQIIDAKGNFLYLNKTAASQIGSNIGTLIGKEMAETYPDPIRASLKDCINKCHSQNIPCQMVIEKCEAGNSKKYTELRLEPIREGVMIFSIDITREKKIENKLREDNRQLDEMIMYKSGELKIKNKELEQLSYVALHDLREPIRVVSNYIAVLKEDYGHLMDSTAHSYLSAIHRATQRMNNLTKAMLEYLRIGRNSKLSTVNIKSLIDEVILELQDEIKEQDAKIEILEMPTITIYRNETKELFHHLISNAIKFKQPHITPLINISAEKSGDKWKFHVKDNGIGIDTKHIERIFNIFQRLHKQEEYEGNGIGLANCRKIVEIHGGECYVESVPGKGSDFIFTFSNLKNDEQKNKLHHAD